MILSTQTTYESTLPFLQETKRPMSKEDQWLAATAEETNAQFTSIYVYDKVLRYGHYPLTSQTEVHFHKSPSKRHWRRIHYNGHSNSVREIPKARMVRRDDENVTRHSWPMVCFVPHTSAVLTQCTGQWLPHVPSVLTLSNVFCSHST